LPTHSNFTEDFLIVFTSKATMDRLNGEHFINGRGFPLMVQVGARRHLQVRSPRRARAPWHPCVGLSLVHIGAHLGFELLPTRSRADLAVFWLSTGSRNLACIRPRWRLLSSGRPITPPSHTHHAHLPHLCSAYLGRAGWRAAWCRRTSR
jgi:hypothetical protein